ncbi:MAG: TonB-dependent receptor [Pseudomonadota bacterium]
MPCKRWFFGTIVSVIACLLPPSGPLRAQDTGYESVLDEIIVTARRREENLQDLPMSIAAISADTMQVQGIYNIEDVGEFVPNLSMTTSDRANNTQIFIRGIGGGDPDPVFPVGTGMYIDGHYIPNSLGGYMSTLDIERVEVLRGPQGTLFGKNTTGGAVNIISAKPSPDFQSSLTLRAGEFGQQDIRAMVNFAVAENVFARITAAKEQDKGYYYNRNLGIWTGGGDLEAMTAALRFTPGDHWTIDATLSLAQQRDDNHGGQCATGDGNIPPWGGARWYGDPGSVMYQAVCDEDAAFGPYVNSSDKVTYSNVDLEGVFVAAQWDSDGRVGGLDRLSVKINASHRYTTYTYLQDRDYSSFRIDAIGTFGADGQNNRTRNGEFLLEGVVNDRLQFVVGINYFEEIALNGKNRCYTLFVNQHDLALDNDVECLPQEGLFFELVPDKVDILGLPFTVGPPTFFNNISVWNESVGVFAHLTYRLNDNWDLDLGARYTEDRREFNNIEFHTSNYQRTNDLGLGSVDLIMNNLTVVDHGFFNTGADTFSEVTPMISVTRQLQGGERLDSGMLYLLYAEGFLTGGFNTELNTSPANPAADLLKPFQAFEPEHVNDYEFGFKGSFGDDRVRLNTTVFYMDYTDIQAGFSLDNSEGQFGGGDADIGIIANIADAEIYGLELELRAGLWEGGIASFDLGYTHYETGEFTTFDEDALAQGIVQLIDLPGNASDQWTINASLQYHFDLANGARLTPMLGIYWERTDVTFGPNQGPGRAFLFCQREHDYAKWRARLSYQPPDGDYQLSLFGNNITDELIYEGCGQGRGAYNYRHERPVSWGVEFSARWGG